MAEWKFNFPASRSCLWDETPTAQSLELHLTRNSWLCVQFSLSALQLAVRHAKQKSNKTLDCFLIATAWVTDAEGVALEVDRFDPGRLDVSGQKLVPTTLIPGDIAIPCHTVVGCLPQASYLTHNLANMQEAFRELKHFLSLHPSSLDPALLLSLRIHCTCSKDGTLTVRCGCVLPALMCEATPINPIAIVQTALARNLSGPLPLSALQGRIKHGYITMESTRKLVLLLHSDPKASSLPLIGIWISGVGSVYHPLVWLACVTYIHSSVLCDRVCGEDGRFVTLVYCEGSTQPTYWQCTVNNGRSSENIVSFEVASGETKLQPTADGDSVCIELHPAMDSSALHTLLEAAHGSPSQITSSASPSMHMLSMDVSCDMPLPFPHPTPTQVPSGPSRDSELSMLSCLSLADNEPVMPSHTTPSVQHYSQMKNKENVPPNKGKEFNTSTSMFGSPLHNRNESLSTSHSSQSTMTSETQSGPSSQETTTTTTPLNRQEVLRQQELEQQLKALQEQVKCLLRSQTETPGVVNTPTNEVSTNTGASLCWPQHAHPPPPPPFSLSPQYTTQGSVCGGENSVCSTMMDGISVDTATSMLSQDTSQLHLDLQSFAHSPSRSRSASFEESASTVGANNEECDSEAGSPASLLFKDQQQFYRNMLAQVNDLLQIQCPEETPSKSSCSSEASPSRSYSSSGNTPPEHTVTQNSPNHDFTLPFTTESIQQTVLTSSEHSAAPEGICQNSMSGYVASHSSRTENSLPVSHAKTRFGSSSNQILAHPDELDSNDTQLLPNSTPMRDDSLPKHSTLQLHPDVLQQCYATDISMLPVPRIMCSRGFDGDISVTSDTLLLNPMSNHGYNLGSTDCTLDENSQLADMITLKYLKGKGVGKILHGDGLHADFGKDAHSGKSDSQGMTNMSMATRQYLQRHHLMPRGGGGGNSVLQEEDHSVGVSSDTGSESERILDIQRLRTLPKLI